MSFLRTCSVTRHRLPVVATLLLAGCVQPFGRGPAFERMITLHPQTFRERDRAELRGGTWLANPEFEPGPVGSAAVPDGTSAFRWRFVTSTRPAAPPNALAKSPETADRQTLETTETWPPAPEPVASADAEETVERGAERDAPSFGRQEIDDAALRERLDDDGLVGWNAAILLARRRDVEAGSRAERILRRLVVERPEYSAETGAAIEAPGWWPRFAADSDQPTVQPVRIGASLHAAAAEAWVHWLGTTATSPVDALAPVGLLLERNDLPHHVRAELYRGAARWVRPALLPYVDEAISGGGRGRGRSNEGDASAPAELRRAAIEACWIHAVTRRERGATTIDDDAWPRRMGEARWDVDPSVRIAYGRWAVASGHHAAFDVLRDQLADESPRVREAAVAGLGRLRSEAAREELTAIAENVDSPLRIEAIEALGAWGPRAIEGFAGDKAHAARLAVTESLARLPSPRSAGLLLGLVTDRNPRVEETVVTSMADWPDALAVPVLLQALEEGAWPTRTAAERQLSRRLGRDLAYQKSASLEERRRMVGVLVERYALPRTLQSAAFETITAEVPRGRREELASYLDDLPAADDRGRRLLLDRLLAAGPEEVHVLEGLLEDRPTIADVVYREVLPEISAAHEALRLLGSTDLADRRAGARELERLAGAVSLSPFVLHRLHASLLREANPGVWRSVLRAVAPDAAPPAAQIVRVALERSSPEIRVQACEYIAAHGRADHAAWLLPLFRDDRPEVVRAAVRAAGRCANPIVVQGIGSRGDGEPYGLVALLVHPNVGVQREAAVALALLGDARGVGEIDRLSRSPDLDVRLAAIGAMRESGRAEFVSTLVHIVETEHGTRVQREAFAALDHIVSAEDRPGLPDWTRAPDAAATAWRAWWKARA